MAGENIKSTALTNVDAGKKTLARIGRGRLVAEQDTYQFASVAAGLDTGDTLMLDIKIPSNAIIYSIEMFNDDMDTNACPTLVSDFGLAAAQDFTSVTSAVATKHTKDDIIDANILVSGATTGRAATTNWTVLTPANGPEKVNKEVWQLLGYDADPHVDFNVVHTATTAAASLSAAADMSIRVKFLAD